MPTLLHPKFLSDEEEYARAEALWKQRWQQLMDETGQGESWQTPWFNTAFLDGTPFRDGNPIFSAVCPSRRLGVQVIQLDPTEHDLEFRARADTFAKGDPEEVRYLAIACVLSDETLPRAIDAVRQWIRHETVGDIRRAS